MPLDYNQVMAQWGQTPQMSPSGDRFLRPSITLDGSTISPTMFSGDDASQISAPGTLTATGGSIPSGWQEYLFPGGSKMVQQSGGYLNDPTHLAELASLAIGGAAASGAFGGGSAGGGLTGGLGDVGSSAATITPDISLGGGATTSSVTDLGAGLTASPLTGTGGSMAGYDAGADLGGGLDSAGISGDASLGGVGVTGGGTVGGGALNGSSSMISSIMSNLSNPGNMMDLAKGVMGLFGSKQMNNAPGAGMADPFASQRGMYQGQLAQLMSNFGQTDVSKLPGYQAGLQAVMRAGGAQGFMNSGNMMAELAQYGQNAYQQNIQNQLAEAQLLGHFAGADTGSPVAAGQLAQSGQTNAWNLAGQAMNSLGSAIMPPIADAASSFINSMNIWG